MKDKNKKLIIIVSVLLLGIGVSFSYFIVNTLTSGSGASTKVTTANINNSTLKVEGTLEFNEINGILPGHKVVSKVKITATGNNEIISYNLIWKGTNNLNTPINYTVYKSSNDLSVSANCENKTKVVNGKQHLNEECSITNIDSLGESLGTGTINKSTEESKVILADGEFITSSEIGTSIYYYVILEYPNLEENQNSDIGGRFDGLVTVEASETKADVNILAVNISDDGKNYTSTQDIPQTGYTLNKSKSTCTNGGVPNWENANRRFYIDNLTKSGTSCTLYFDKGVPKSIQDIIASLNPKTGTNEFSAPATTEAESGLYSTTDDNGTTYYYRGIVNNNWVDFAGLKWRIVRINGDGTIRMIYNGNSYTTTGTTTQLQTSAFNSSYNHNAYVGYMYGTTANDYASTHKNTNNSTIKGKLDNWYKTNILDKNYDSYVSKEAGFCGDRQVASGHTSYTGNGGGTGATVYAPANRLSTTNLSGWKTTQAVTYSCNTNDLYTVAASSKGNHALQYPVGLISADEVIYAGGFGGAQNQQYWLYTNQVYWTMSPYHFNGQKALLFYTANNGNLTWVSVEFTAPGVRPVVNLSASVQLTGSGTTTDPFKIDGV